MFLILSFLSMCLFFTMSAMSQKFEEFEYIRKHSRSPIVNFIT